MKITVASGKGGTGKTTVAVSLALAHEGPLCLADADVEEPNLHIFLGEGVEFEEEEIIGIPIPRVDEEKCTLCGVCQEVCQYNAILVTKNGVKIFDELCKGCGGCTLLCPEKAISEVPFRVGKIRRGKKNSINFIEGLLDLGNINTTYMIKQLKDRIKMDRVVIDAPPGVSCPMMECVKDADYVVLVTEPTPFGLFDLDLSVKVLRKMKIPFGVIVNKDTSRFPDLDAYLEREDVSVLMRIPFKKEIAHSYASGVPLIEAFPEWRNRFQELWEKVEAKVR